MPRGLIVRVLSGFYTVFDGEKSYVCKARGKFRKDGLKPMVGDYCEFSDESIVMRIEERKNSLIRPPMANVDLAFIIMSAREPDFSTLLLDRFLVLIESRNIEPCIIITKMDLISENDPLHQTIEAYQKAGYRVLLSAKGKDIKAQIQPLCANKIAMFTGQTGVGKSTLLNQISPDLKLQTGEISMVLGRGKHTTRHVELYPLFDGWIADTPGFSNLDLDIDERTLATSFHDFKELSQHCKFRGCLHQSEPGCQVKTAVEDKTISIERYNHYLEFLKEIKSKKGKFK